MLVRVALDDDLVAARDTIVRNPMPLTAGTQLGPKEILAPIGAGGMGEGSP